MITVPVQDRTKPFRILVSAQLPANLSRTTDPLAPDTNLTPGSSASDATAPMSDTLELQLYNNAADLKLDFAKYTIHLNAVWRKCIFSQLDILLAEDAWDEESSILRVDSFKTFLRFLAYSHPMRMPSLGVDHQGNLITAWIDDPRRLFATFLANDRINASMIGITTRGEEELTSWSGPVSALREAVERMGNRSCLDVLPA